MSCRHCTWTSAVLLCAAVLAGTGDGLRAQGATQSKPVVYTIFLRGTPIGREEVRVKTDATGTTITSESRASLPQITTIRKAEVHYTPDWNADAFAIEGSVNGGEVNVKTTFENGVAKSNGVLINRPLTREHPVAPRTMILVPTAFYGGWEALTRQVTTASGPVEMRGYLVPEGETAIKVSIVANERMQLGTQFLDVRRYEVLIQTAQGDLPANITATADGALVRLSLPAQGFDLVREDVAAATSRTQIYTNPGDEPVRIPALGFSLGATLTRPKTAAARMPVAILLGGSGVGDRDGTVAGVATLAQLAGRLADAGILAVRFDKRGYGQSGGRPESATLTDYAEDVRAVVKWVADRKDVDNKRIALVGHSEGAWVGMLAAGREDKVAALVTLAGPATTGGELILEQQQTALNTMELSAEERESRVALQKQIQGAVITGKGWETIPAAMRKQADTPWFQSVLQFDPAQTIKRVKQPLLLVHGALDQQVPVSHAERLADLARKESKSKAVELVIVKGVNHLLTPAETGAVTEYATLTDRNVSMDVSTAVTGWLTKTFQNIN